MKKIKILKIYKDVITPKYMTKGSCGLDIRAYLKKNVTLYPFKSKLITTGIRIYIKKKNITAIIVPRSGLSYKKKIILGNTIGIIDSDYQGELKILLYNQSKKKFIIKNKDRIAQIIFIPILKINFDIVKNFKHKTKRHISGFGYTGIK